MRLTSIFLKVNGAEIRASVAGTLTSGMVGIPVTIEYDEAWEGLTKNLVCRCSKSGFDDEEYRSILNVGNTAVVAHEVMQAGKHLWLGVEGYNADGTLVIPTTWAMCGVIQRGANTGDDFSADPTLPIWGQLQTQIEQIKQDAVTPEQMTEVLSGIQSAVQATAIYAGRAEAAAKRAEEGLVNSGQGGGMTAAAKEALMAVVEAVGVWDHPDPQALIDNLRNALFNAPVAAISAVYTQTRTVYTTDSLEVLRNDLVVTATYTDGSSAVSTAYTLSGTLTAGVSVITATLDGKTATFEVQVAAARIPAMGITLSSQSIGITAGEPVRLVATVEPENSTDTVVWASSEEAVATVAQDGTVTPIASGSCTVTATAGAVSAGCAVTVSMPLTGYNFGNPYLNYVDSDPTTLGKTDAELMGKFYSSERNNWAKAISGGESADFGGILLYPMSGGTFYVRTVNRSRLPNTGFMVFGNGDIVANPTKFLASLPQNGGTDAETGVTVERFGAFDWTDSDGVSHTGECNLGASTGPTGGGIGEAMVYLYKITVPDDAFVFFRASVKWSPNDWPAVNDNYPVNELYTIFRDDPSGNILQIAKEED